MAIDELRKPMGSWCPHAKPGLGCGIYGQHPPTCQAFMCLWLADQDIPDAMRPDRSKVVMEADSDGTRLIARCDPGHPTAWRREPIYGQLKRIASDGWRRGISVVAMVNRRIWVVTPKSEIDLGEVDPRSPFSVEEMADGSIKVEVLPPLLPAQTFKPTFFLAED